MANLVCWASGLLEILANKDTPLDSGPVVLLNGRTPRLRTKILAHGEQREQPDGSSQWYVSGTKPVPDDPAEAAKVQRDNMTLVIAFNNRLHGVRG